MKDEIIYGHEIVSWVLVKQYNTKCKKFNFVMKATGP